MKVTIYSLGFTREGALIARIHRAEKDPHSGIGARSLQDVRINPEKLYQAIEDWGMGYGGKGHIAVHHAIGHTFRFAEITDQENPFAETESS